MDFKKHLETAWDLTLKYIAPLICMTLLMFIVSIISIGILWPVTTAGYVYSILMILKEKREPKLQDIFSQMRLFFPLLGFGIFLAIIVAIGLLMFVLPGVFIILAVTFCCLYMIPLMVDKEMGLLDAVKKSYALSVQGELVDQIVVVLLFIGITAIGNSIFIGALFTQPFATIFMVSVYMEKLNDYESPELPEIESSAAS